MIEQFNNVTDLEAHRRERLEKTVFHLSSLIEDYTKNYQNVTLVWMHKEIRNLACTLVVQGIKPDRLELLDDICNYLRSITNDSTLNAYEVQLAPSEVPPQIEFCAR